MGAQSERSPRRLVMHSPPPRTRHSKRPREANWRQLRVAHSQCRAGALAAAARPSPPPTNPMRSNGRPCVQLLQPRAQQRAPAHRAHPAECAARESSIAQRRRRLRGLVSSARHLRSQCCCKQSRAHRRYLHRPARIMHAAHGRGRSTRRLVLRRRCRPSPASQRALQRNRAHEQETPRGVRGMGARMTGLLAGAGSR
jgi:hypothetical protein